MPPGGHNPLKTQQQGYGKKIRTANEYEFANEYLWYTPRVCIIFLILVNYSAYTTLSLHWNIVQMMHFKTFVKFLLLKRSCM